MATPTRPSEVLEKLSRTKSVEILLTVDEDPHFVSQLIDVLGGSASTIEKRTDELLGLDLLNEERQETYPRRRTFYITPEGRKVAKHLRTMAKSWGIVPKD